MCVRVCACVCASVHVHQGHIEGASFTSNNDVPEIIRKLSGENKGKEKWGSKIISFLLFKG